MTALEEHFKSFDFLQLVRVLLRPRQADEPAPTPDQALRFCADLSAAFPGRNASALSWLPGPGAPDWLNLQDATDPPTAPARVQISTPDFCVGSVLGPLPEAFLEWMRDLERLGQVGMRDFLDLFNHRINVLRYRARAEFEPGLNNQLPERTLQAQWLGALMGVGSDSAASQLPLRERNWLGIGELLANNRRSAAGVVQVLGAHLRCPVQLIPLTPAWRALGASNEQPLGQRRLGQDSLLGRSLWDVQADVRINIGPISYLDLVRLLPPSARQPPPDPLRPPGRELTARELQRQWRLEQDAVACGRQTTLAGGYDALAALVRLMLDRRHDAQLRIMVAERGIPPSRLTAQPAPGLAGLRLGQTAWLKSRSRPGQRHPHRGARARLRTVRLSVPAFAPQSP
ncbi:type VI secretion system baseplate subunit TssG [Rhodoferax sp.]|uniref:type VI secretion system baseplate subunit TssG n=1 Tax=Rhodoferax sp. TaxID=50421 RepID=UPI002743E656|nr:type VI secretion system baseplate subunit TssG [Rhodoferax sp.]